MDNDHDRGPEFLVRPFGARSPPFVPFLTFYGHPKKMLGS